MSIKTKKYQPKIEIKFAEFGTYEIDPSVFCPTLPLDQEVCSEYVTKVRSFFLKESNVCLHVKLAGENKFIAIGKELAVRSIITISFTEYDPEAF